MKFHFTLFLVLTCYISFAQDVVINDANFLAAVDAAGFDTNNDDVIQVTEAQAVTELVLNSKGIADLTGIEAFTNLLNLYLYDNALTGALDLTALTALEKLQLSKNALTSLNIVGLTQLVDLRCSENSLSIMDLSDQINLTYLDAAQNSFVAVDLTSNHSLVSAYFDYTPSLTTLIVDGISTLRVLSCKNCSIGSFDFGGLASIEEIYCFGNNLTTLNVSGLSTLKRLNANNNSITDVEISGIVSCWELGFLNNNLTTINVKGLTSLPGTGIMRVDGNPNLTSVCVDNLTDPGTNWYVDSPTVYTDNCTIASMGDGTMENLEIVGVYDVMGNELLKDATGMVIVHYSNGAKTKEFRQ